MEIKDYLHLYLGCQIQLADGSIEKLKCVDSDISLVNMGWGNAQDTDTVKPILRPLSDITEDELLMLGVKPQREWHEPTLAESKKWILDNQHLEIYSPKEVLFLLSKHFDLFGLIDAGLAIDATTLLNKDQGVQECDATDVPSSNQADNKINNS